MIEPKVELNKGKILWVDVETTGLDPRSGEVLECAAVITNNEIEVEARRCWVIHHRVEHLDMSDTVRVMHTENGLLEEVAASDMSPADFEEDCIAWLKDNQAWGCPLAGNTVSFDRAWMVEHFPELMRHCSYRNINLSSIRDLFMRWGIDTFTIRPTKHRARYDIMASVFTAQRLRTQFVL